MKLNKSQLKEFILKEAEKVRKEIALTKELEEVNNQLQEVMGGAATGADYESGKPGFAKKKKEKGAGGDFNAKALVEDDLEEAAAEVAEDDAPVTEEDAPVTEVDAPVTEDDAPVTEEGMDDQFDTLGDVPVEGGGEGFEDTTIDEELEALSTETGIPAEMNEGKATEEGPTQLNEEISRMKKLAGISLTESTTKE